MQPLVTADEMRWCDEYTIRKIGIPGLVLMENAGREVAQFLGARFGPIASCSCLIFCGKGNNGGDGFVVARHLVNKGMDVTVILLASPSELKGDAKTNFEIVKKIAKDDRRLRVERFNRGRLAQSKPVVIVDAMFGTGFKGKVPKLYSDAIDWINRQACPVIAVDIPSGVNGTTGVAEGVAVKATATVTFGLRKVGLFCNHARDLVGELHLADIGIPESVVEKGGFKTHLVEADDVFRFLPRRPSTAHKYSVGKVFVLGGSRGYTGAAALCATSALRSGAGAVVLGTPHSVYHILARKLTEVIVEPLAETKDDSVAEDAWDLVQKRIQWADVVVVGPGLSRNAETLRLAEKAIFHCRRVVVDADALAVLPKIKSMIKKSTAEMIFTPHTGEFSRMVGKHSRDIDVERVRFAQEGARAFGKIVVLKGAPTITAMADRFSYLNPTGNPGMATVGSGDVLAGIIAGLWAQHISAKDAAMAGVYLHGLAGDIAAASVGEKSLVAADLIDQIPMAFRSLESKGAA